MVLFADLLSLELSRKDDKMSLMDIAGYSSLSESMVHFNHLYLF